eukprot:1372-Heterococcus_DN1.PRE.5
MKFGAVSAFAKLRAIVGVYLLPIAQPYQLVRVTRCAIRASVCSNALRKTECHMRNDTLFTHCQWHNIKACSAAPTGHNIPYQLHRGFAALASMLDEASCYAST